MERKTLKETLLAAIRANGYADVLDVVREIAIDLTEEKVARDAHEETEIDAYVLSHLRALDGDLRDLEAFSSDDLGRDACPGCGCVPGDGRTDGCTHPYGCGAHA